MQNCDVLIIGSGGSGLSLAIKLKQSGVKNILILSKTSIMGSHTSAAKGGINATLSSVIQDDYKWHAYDTLKSAGSIGDAKRIEYMCKQAPAEIAFLQSIGVQFNKLPNGKIDQRKYGGQKLNYGKGDFAYRACFAKDSTGFEIMKNLKSQALKEKIKIKEYSFCFEAKAVEKTIQEVHALNLQTGEFEKIKCKIIVFAGGGFSQIYKTNSSSNALTGDSQMLALKAGAKLTNMEFVQFHPTGLKGNGILISEAVRAEGGYLYNKSGERFMKKYNPDFMELASRDVIAKAIFEEKEAFLSLKHLPHELVKNKLTGTISTARFFGGVDVFSKDIKVFPTAHYNMGGIAVDYNYKVKGLKNAFAIGECADAKIHGANRLGCNSLLELFTSSTLASLKIKQILKQDAKVARRRFNINPLLNNENKISFNDILYYKERLGEIMEEKCGVIREARYLKEALQSITEMEKIFSNSSPLINDLVFSNEFVAFYEVYNLIGLAKHVVKSALKRKTSLGSHIII